MNINKCGEPSSEDIRNKKSKSHIGKNHSEETKQKISESNKGKHSDSSKHVKVVQLSKNGTLIHIWNSLKEAKDHTGINV